MNGDTSCPSNCGPDRVNHYRSVRAKTPQTIPYFASKVPLALLTEYNKSTQPF